MENWVGTVNLHLLYATKRLPFSKSTNTLPTTVHGHAFRIITWQHHREGTPYPPLKNVLGNSVGRVQSVNIYMSTQWPFQEMIAHWKTYSMQLNVIKFVSDVRHIISGFLWFLHQPVWPPRYNWNIAESSVKHL